MSNTFITIYTDKWQAIRSIKAISERERQKLAAALLDYGCLNILPSGLSNLSQGMFEAIKSSLFARTKGGQIGNHNASKNKNECNTNNKTNDENESENECKNDCEKTNKNELYKLQTTDYKLQTTETPKSPLRGKSLIRFQKPTVDEVREYVSEMGYHINPNDFVDFYESKGWLVGKTPMKDWKAAVRNWESKEKAENPTNYVPEKPKKPVPEVRQCPECGSYDLGKTLDRVMCRGCGAIYDYNHTSGKWEKC